MNTTYELNNLRKDSDFLNREMRATSVVAEVFSAMVNGNEVGAIKGADKAVKYIKELGNRADNGDFGAIAELNTLRRFVIEAPLMKEMKLLGIFGSYQAVGWDETIEREVYKHVGEKSREQAESGDVVFPAIVKEVYPVPTFTVSGGYAVDYRRVALGDMSKENEGMEQVRIDIRNKAMRAIVLKVYEAIHNATGVKYAFENASLTKAGVDGVLTKIRRFGRPTVIGDYAILSQFTPWAGYVGSINSNTITGISEAQMNEIAQNGLLGMYNGAVLAEIENPYDETNLNATGDDFETMLPAGLGFIVPTGAKSPIATYTRGGLTSFTGNNVKNGKVEMRMDLEVGVDIAKGQEYKIGMFLDSNISSL
jgi:hypothetical protein